MADYATANTPAGAYFTQTATAGTSQASYAALDWNNPYNGTEYDRTSASVASAPGYAADYGSDVLTGANSVLDQYAYSAPSQTFTDVQTYSFGDVIPTTAVVRDTTGITAGSGPVGLQQGNYVESYDINQVTQAPKDATGRTMYDYQRERILQDAEQERARREEALNRYLTANGLEDSGVAVQQMASMNQELASETQRQLSDVAIEELGFQQEETSKGSERAYEQNLFNREMDLKESFFSLEAQGQYEQYQQQLRDYEELRYQYDIATGIEKQKLGQELVMQERDLNATANNLRSELESTEKLAYMQNAESARQFDAALIQKATEIAADLRLRGDVAANELAMDLARFEELKYQFDAAQGLEKEQMYQDFMIARNDMITSTNQVQMRIDADKDIEQQRAMNDYYLALNDQDGKKALAVLNGRIETSLVNLEAAIEEQNAINELKRKMYFNMGQSGTEIPQDELTALKQSDPAAWTAYQGGVAGKTYDDMEIEANVKQQYIDAAIMNLAEYKGDEFMSHLNELYQEMGLPLPGNLSETAPIGAVPAVPINPNGGEGAPVTTTPMDVPSTGSTYTEGSLPTAIAMADDGSTLGGTSTLDTPPPPPEGSMVWKTTEGDQVYNIDGKFYNKVGSDITDYVEAGRITVNQVPAVAGDNIPNLPDNYVTGYTRTTRVNPYTQQQVPEGFAFVPGVGEISGYSYQVDPTTGITVTVDPHMTNISNVASGNGLMDTISRRPAGTQVEDAVAAHYRVNGWQVPIPDTISVPNQPNDMPINATQKAAIEAARQLVVNDPDAIEYLGYQQIVEMPDDKKAELIGKPVIISDTFGYRGFAPGYIMDVGNDGRLFMVNLESGLGDWVDVTAARDFYGVQGGSSNYLMDNLGQIIGNEMAEQIGDANVEYVQENAIG